MVRYQDFRAPLTDNTQSAALPAWCVTMASNSLTCWVWIIWMVWLPGKDIHSRHCLTKSEFNDYFAISTNSLALNLPCLTDHVPVGDCRFDPQLLSILWLGCVCVCNQMCTPSRRERGLSQWSQFHTRRVTTCSLSLRAVTYRCPVLMDLGACENFLCASTLFHFDPRHLLKSSLNRVFLHRYSSIFSISSDFPRWKHWTDRAVSGSHTTNPFGLWVSSRN